MTALALDQERHRPLPAVGLLLLEDHEVVARAAHVGGAPAASKTRLLSIVSTDRTETVPQLALTSAALQLLLLTIEDRHPACVWCWQTPRATRCAWELGFLEQRLHSCLWLAQYRLRQALLTRDRPWEAGSRANGQVLDEPPPVVRHASAAADRGRRHQENAVPTTDSNLPTHNGLSPITPQTQSKREPAALNRLLARRERVAEAAAAHTAHDLPGADLLWQALDDLEETIRHRFPQVWRDHFPNWVALDVERVPHPLGGLNRVCPLCPDPGSGAVPADLSAA